MSNNKRVNLKNMDLYSMGRDLLHRLWIVILIGCMGTMITYTYMIDSYVPQYTSSAIYVVTPRQSTGYVYTNKRFAESAIIVFQNLLNADIMKSRIQKEIHVKQLNTVMSAELITETNLMKVTATSDSPIEAFEAIGAIMNNYAELSEYLTADATFDTLKEPSVAVYPNNILTPRKKSLQMGAICTLAAMLVVLAISFLRKTIKTESAVEEQLDTTLLGTIYHENKNKTIKAKIVQRVKALLITSPIISSKFIESINNIRIKMEYEHERCPEKNVYMFTSVCENEGKTTIATNLALSLAKEGKKVIVIDADMRKPSVYKILNIPKIHVVDLVKLLQGQCGLDEVMYHEKQLGLDMIMSTKGHTSTYEFIKSGAMKDLIRKCRVLADYVIIDTPPMAMVSDAEALLDRVDFASLIVRQDFSYEKDIVNSLNIINDSNTKLLGCILNDYKVFRVDSKKHAYEYVQNGGKVVEIYDKQ